MEATQDRTITDIRTKKYVVEITVVVFLTFFVYLISSRYDLIDFFYEFSRAHEYYELDEVLAMFVFLVFSTSIFAIRRWIEVNRTLVELSRKNRELEKAIAEIRQLRGILPICASCKKIRDDEGYWHRVEQYIQDHSEAQFSHGICPECLKKIYPELSLEENR